MSQNRNRWIKILVLSLIVLSIGSYALFNSRLLITGPKLEVFEPQNGSSFNDPVIEIKGRALNISHISLNDYQIFVDEDGFFTEKLLLSPGQSIIKLYATDKFEREVETLLYYVYNGTSTEMIPQVSPASLDDDLIDDASQDSEAKE